MKALSAPNIESELSYAYLHAVASRAGMACTPGGRHEDNNGVDAQITAWGPFAGGGYLTEVTMKIQLKATIAEPTGSAEHWSYSLRGIERYDDLRSNALAVPRFLVVLFLPSASTEWLEHSVDKLVLKKCAYWVSLRNAPETTNSTATTVYLPKVQIFGPRQLTTLATGLSHPGTHIDYELP